MLRDVAVTRIQSELGFRTDQADNIVLRLQEAQRLLERGRTLPYFLLEEGVEIPILSGEDSFDLPERFLREEAEHGLRFVDADTGGVVFLEKLDYKNATLSFVTEEAQNGQPRAYSLLKETVQLWPASDADRTLLWSYYKGGELLTTNVENVWLDEEIGAPEALWARAGMLMARNLGNPTAYETFQALFVEAYAGMLGDTFQREAENKPLYMGGRL